MSLTGGDHPIMPTCGDRAWAGTRVTSTPAKAPANKALAEVALSGRANRTPWTLSARSTRLAVGPKCPRRAPVGARMGERLLRATSGCARWPLTFDAALCPKRPARWGWRPTWGTKVSNGPHAARYKSRACGRAQTLCVLKHLVSSAVIGLSEPRKKKSTSSEAARARSRGGALERLSEAVLAAERPGSMVGALHLARARAPIARHLATPNHATCWQHHAHL